jgi:hypothetical protein
MRRYPSQGRGRSSPGVPADPPSPAPRLPGKARRAVAALITARQHAPRRPRAPAAISASTSRAFSSRSIGPSSLPSLPKGKAASSPYLAPRPLPWNRRRLFAGRAPKRPRRPRPQKTAPAPLAGCASAPKRWTPPRRAATFARRPGAPCARTRASGPRRGRTVARGRSRTARRPRESPTRRRPLLRRTIPIPRRPAAEIQRTRRPRFAGRRRRGGAAEEEAAMAKKRRPSCLLCRLPRGPRKTAAETAAPPQAIPSPRKKTSSVRPKTTAK